MLGQLVRASHSRINSNASNPYARLRKHGLLLGLGAAAAAALGLQAAADAPDSAAEQLPTDKLACRMGVAPPRQPAVLVSCGSFNPPTIMHLRMFDLATAALAKRGFDVWGCYMSPVADAYGKQGLAPVQQRLQMCQLAAACTSNVMVDSWEATRDGYTRTVQVLRHVSDALASWMQQNSSNCSHAGQAHAAGLAAAAAAASSSSAASPYSSSSKPGQKPATSSSPRSAPTQAAAPTSPPQPQLPRVMLLCGADLLATIAKPGVWVDPDVILRGHGIVCICRQGTDVTQLLDQPGTLLHKYRDNIILVEEPVPNNVSSTKVRQLLAEQQPVRYLVPDPVIAYIKQHSLYRQQQQ